MPDDKIESSWVKELERRGMGDGGWRKEKGRARGEGGDYLKIAVHKESSLFYGQKGRRYSLSHYKILIWRQNLIMLIVTKKRKTIP